MRSRHSSTGNVPLKDEPLWYKDAIIYELHVRAFADSNGDGIGDFRGLVRKLDYLQDLGVTALWLLPFYPSPLRDDGYDIADYTSINPIYGTLTDFKRFLRAAHRRGLRVITELVLNHTSDRHPWFQRARQAAAGSTERDFYVWSDTPEKYKDARIIFKDFEPSNWSWDPVAKSYYWHRFFSHQPDLNFDNPAVHRAVFQVLDFWLGLGIDGLRLDAVPYLYEREGTNCENLPETHAFLRKLRRHIDERYANRLLLAEANQWPEDAVAYFGAGDECHMAFHFPVMPRLFMAIRMEDRFPVLDILQQTPPIPDASQWALFLRNHDELTLEMVTDEDRDYMYRMYAQDPQARINLGIRRRLAPLLENHRGKIELINGLLFSLPGTPVLYYGDEIGMGDNIYLGDRNGVRTPMQWGPERNAGFSVANPQRLFQPVIIDPAYHFETVNVEAQQNNSHSLLWWMKHLIALRKRVQAFGRGSLEFLAPRNHKVLAYVRRYQNECILVVANLSRFPQYVELDLNQFRGLTPVEMFGRTRFPPVGDQPYFLTLGSYAFYWFSLEQAPAKPPVSEPATLPSNGRADGGWEGILSGKSRAVLEEALADHLKRCSWYTGKARQLEAAMILETIPIPYGSNTAQLALVQVEYSEGDSETFALPLSLAWGPTKSLIESQAPASIIARLGPDGTGNPPDGAGEAILYDALADGDFGLALLQAIARRRRFKRANGEVLAAPLGHLRKRKEALQHVSAPVLLSPERSNSSLVYGDKFFLKFIRRVEEGVNPELEIERSLAEKTSFAHASRAVGVIEYRRSWGEPITLGVLQEYVPNQGDAWQLTLDSLGAYYDRALTGQIKLHELPAAPADMWALTRSDIPQRTQELIGPYLETVQLIGRRTGEFHKAMISICQDPCFAPEPFTPLDQRSRYQAIRTQIVQTMEALRHRLHDLPEPSRAPSQTACELEAELLRRARAILECKISAQKIRCHGNFNLGQLLSTGKDVVFIDFDGDVTRPLNDRRRKRPALGDVAAMLRSFHYASQLALEKGDIRREDVAPLQSWAQFWYGWIAAIFLRAYCESVEDDELLAVDIEPSRVLLEHLLVRRILFEIRDQLAADCKRLAIPLQALMQLAAPAAR